MTPAPVSVLVNDSAALAVGSYSGQVVFTGGGTSLVVNVTLVVTPAREAVFDRTPEQVSFSMQPGGKPSSQVMQIGNGGSGTLHWRLIGSTFNGAAFLSMSSQTGTAPARITVGVLSENLPNGGATAGVYTGQLLFLSANSIVTIPVSVKVVDRESGPVASFTAQKPAVIALAESSASSLNLVLGNTSNWLCGDGRNQDNLSYGPNTAAPDGTNSAKLVYEGNPENGAVPHFGYIYSDLGSGQQTLSFHFKADIDSWVYITSAVDGVTQRVWFHLTGSGSVGANVPAGWTAQITSLPNGWYRTSVTYTVVNNSFNNGFGLATTDQQYAYVGTPGNGVYQWGQQFQHGTLTDYQANLAPCLTLSKSADAGSVAAGSSIGYKLELFNQASPALATTLNDPLPSGTGINWSISPAYGGPGTCAITGAAGSQTLACDFSALAAGAGTSVHITSATSGPSCGAYSNTATASVLNSGSFQAIATTTVQCPQTIAFGALSNQVLGIAPFTVSAIASSGLPVSFTSQTTPVCSISGTTLTLASYGTCTVQATQAGNTNYAAATPVNQSFQVTNGCAYSIDPSSVIAGSSGASGSLRVTTSAGCVWSATRNDVWDSIVSGSSGTGSGTVGYTVAANGTGAQRSGTFTVAGQTVTVTQAANTFAQAPALVSLSPFQGTGPNATLTLVYSDANGWAAIKSAEFIMNPRWEPAARGGGCYVKYAPGTGLFTLIADDGTSVAGTAAPGTGSNISNSQCTLNAANSSVTGSGNTLTVVASLTFTPSFSGMRHIWMQAVDTNNLSSNWLVYGAWFPTQTTVNTFGFYRIYDPNSHSYLNGDLNEYTYLGTQGFTQLGLAGQIMDSPGSVGGVSNIAWYRLYVNANASHFYTSDRNEFLYWNNQPQVMVGEGVSGFVVPYLKADGTYNLTPPTNMLPFYRAGQGTDLHYWTADADEFFGRNGKHMPSGYTGEGIASWVFPASGAVWNNAAATTESRPATVDPEDGGPSVVGALNAASRASSGVIAPGQVLSVFGRHLGGRVLLNGVAAQVISATDSEIRIVVPKGLTGEVSLQVEHRGRRSKEVKLGVVQANPAIFGGNEYGRGNAQARNEDGTMNGAEHGAARGSVVTLYTTGIGSLDLPVEVHIGGYPAEVLAARESATQGGVIEIQVRVPETVAAGAFQPVVLHVGNLFSQPGVGLADSISMAESRDHHGEQALSQALSNATD